MVGFVSLKCNAIYICNGTTEIKINVIENVNDAQKRNVNKITPLFWIKKKRKKCAPNFLLVCKPI